MAVPLDQRDARKTNPRRAWPAAIWLAGLGLVVAFGLVAHFALEAAYPPNAVQTGAMLPAADRLLDDDTLGDGLLPPQALAEQPPPPRLFISSTILFPLLAAPRPIPHPPQLPAA